jgi:hypothetical protein
MISIIICSISEERSDQLNLNITDTIGKVDFEIIRIDNTVEKLSITKAYNRGAQLAKFSILLFIHEDILFHTLEWGVKLISELKDESTGIVGVAGSSYTPLAPIGYTNPIRKYNFHHLIQHTDKGTKFFSNIPSEHDQIIALDGVFLGVRRDVFDKYEFNDDLPGFHSYDLDISLRVSEHFKNSLTKEILIEHFSSGAPNEQFTRNNISIKRLLKIKNKINDPLNEYSSYRVFIKELYTHDFNKNEIQKLSAEFRDITRFGLLNYFKSFYFTFREKLKH